MNDARCNLALALTAIQQGAVVTNYTEVVGLLKDANLRLTGAMINDRLTGTSFPVYARGVINATGPYCDHVRFMDDPEAMPIVIPSAGSHIVLPGYYSPASMGLIDPRTSDGRVIFFLPWEGNTIAGTTDAPTELSYEPRASPRDIDFILAEIKAYLGPQIKVRRACSRDAFIGAEGGRACSLVRHQALDPGPKQDGHGLARPKPPDRR